MTLVVLQPAGDPAAKKNYEKTIATAIPLKRIKGYLNERDNDALKVRFPSGKAYFWGTTPGSKTSKQTQHAKMSEGDRVLFAKEKTFFASARVRHAFRSKEAAEDLWKTDANDQTWELMFALDDIQRLDVPVAEVLLGRVWNKDFIQSFTVLNEQKSLAVLKYLAFVPEETELNDLARLATSHGIGNQKAKTKPAAFKPKDSRDYEAVYTGKKIQKSRTHELCVKQFGAFVLGLEQGWTCNTEVHPRDLELTRDGTECLVEVKTVEKGNPRNAVREAIGQLFEYQHVYYKNKKPTLLAVFSESIGEMYEDLLTTLGIAFVYRETTDDGAVTWGSSQSARDAGLIV